jgi:hypothetical protein
MSAINRRAALKISVLVTVIHRVVETVAREMCANAGRDVTMIAEWKLPEEQQPILQRIVWFEPARSAARIDSALFLQMAMAYARADELQKIRRYFPAGQFQDALRQAPVGLFDHQFWRYWHKALEMDAAEPLLRRPFVPEAWEQDDRFSKCVVRG